MGTSRPRLTDDEYRRLSPIEQLGVLLDEAGLTIEFGLRQQGHVPTVERMLSEGKTWEEIGCAIGWCPKAAQDWYERFEKG